MKTVFDNADSLQVCEMTFSSSLLC